MQIIRFTTSLNCLRTTKNAMILTFLPYSSLHQMTTGLWMFSAFWESIIMLINNTFLKIWKSKMQIIWYTTSENCPLTTENAIFCHFCNFLPSIKKQLGNECFQLYGNQLLNLTRIHSEVLKIKKCKLSDIRLSEIVPKHQKSNFLGHFCHFLPSIKKQLGNEYS